MTDYHKDPEYIKAATYSNHYTTEDLPSNGFNKTTALSITDKILIAQNNTIIELLIELNRKINNLENKLDKIVEKHPLKEKLNFDKLAE